MSAVLEAREPSARYLEPAQPTLIRQFELLATAPNGVARLRELILALAVQGKLTRRDAQATPAPALLARILKQKESLIAAGRIKREKPLPPIDEADPPFEIPQSWCWVRLGSVTNYGSPTKGESIGPETWVLDLEDIEKATGRLVHRVRRSERPSLSEKCSFQTGDVLYGKLRPYLNKVIVADEPGVCTTELVPFRCYGDWVPQYFKIALSSPTFLEYVKARSYGMKMPRLGTEDARSALLPLPPLEEQARIAARVDELMHLCDALKAQGRLEAEQHARLLATLLSTLTDSTTPEELAANWQRVAEHFDLLLDRPEAVDVLEQAVLQLAVRGLLVPQDLNDEAASHLIQKMLLEVEDLVAKKRIRRPKEIDEAPDDDYFSDLPKGWALTRLGLLGDWGAGATPLRSDSRYFGGPIPWFKSGELVADTIFTSEESVSELALQECSLRLNQPGDVLIAMYGATIGKVSVLGVSGTTNQAVCACTPFSGVNNSYLLLLLKALKPYFISIGAGGAQPNISREKIVATKVALPPLAEQSRIVARVTQLHLLCADLRQRLAASQATQSRLAEALVDAATA